MVFGAYYLTLEVDGAKGEGKVFRHAYEVERAFDAGDVDLHAKIVLRTTMGSSMHTAVAKALGEDHDTGEVLSLDTTPGRVFFNSALPKGFRFVNDVVGKRSTPIGGIVEEISATEPKHVVAASLDRVKALGFRYAAQSGLTISIDDVRTPPREASHPRPLRA